MSVEIHCHCLPGLDDGPATPADAVALCRALVADGVTDVIATPHQLGRYDLSNDADRVCDAVRSLSSLLDQEQVPLRIYPGGDVRIDERLPLLLRERRVLTLGDTGRYLLLELPTETYIDPLRLIADLARRGVIVILSHPERHEFLSAHPDRVRPWLARGAFLQITAGSVCGDFGPAAEQAAWHWFDQGAVDLIASDAHDCVRRAPRLSAAIERIARRYGRDTAHRTALENPRRVLAGEELSRAVLNSGLAGFA